MLTIAEIGAPLHRVEPAVDVVRDEVVEEDVADRQAVVCTQLVLDLPNRKLGVESRRHEGRLVEAKRGLVGRRNRNDARTREIALGVLVAAEKMCPVANDRPTDIAREDVDIGWRFSRRLMRPLGEEGKGGK